MSLASTAALINDDLTSLLPSSSSSSSSSSSPFSSSLFSSSPSSGTRALDQLQEKRRSRTQKVYPKENFDSRKVNSVLERIYAQASAGDDDQDEDEDRGDEYFRQPPPPPQSMGATRRAREGMTTVGGVPKPTYIEKQALDGNSYQANYHSDDKARDEYYRSVMANYAPSSSSSSSNSNNHNHKFERHAAASSSAAAAAPVAGGDVMMQKMNYVIHLLEESHDQKTGSITEEVVLYSFLGVFIIFIADSFVRVGKYGKYIR